MQSSPKVPRRLFSLRNKSKKGKVSLSPDQTDAGLPLTPTEKDSGAGKSADEKESKINRFFGGLMRNSSVTKSPLSSSQSLALHTPRSAYP
jgi:hypothetical protein